MIKLLNKIGGILTLIGAIIVLGVSKDFRVKYLQVKEVVSKSILVNFELPPFLINAIIAIEDERYDSHLGVDFYSICRALRNRITKKRIEGASTLPQQVVRIALDKREVSFLRKANEILLSVLISNVFSKKQILISYCKIYQFEKLQGIDNLCQKEKLILNNLTFRESCQIAARFKYPILKKSNYSKYLKRVRIIEIKTIQISPLLSKLNEGTTISHF